MSCSLTSILFHWNPQHLKFNLAKSHNKLSPVYIPVLSKPVCCVATNKWQTADWSSLQCYTITTGKQLLRFWRSTISRVKQSRKRSFQERYGYVLETDNCSGQHMEVTVLHIKHGLGGLAGRLMPSLVVMNEVQNVKLHGGDYVTEQ